VRGGLDWRDRDLHPVVYERLPRMQGVRMGPSPAGARGWLVAIVLLLLLLSACATTGKDTIAELRSKRIEIKEEKIEDASEKAIENYRRFLEQTSHSALKPEALRRLADLKAEKEYAALSGNASGKKPDQSAAPSKAGDQPVQGIDDLQPAGPREAIELYEKLLTDYPSYERNDQVLYQMSRAYEELGQIEEAMQVMDGFVRDYPRSRYIDEVQFRRAEYFFTRRKYPDAAEAYGSIITMGTSSSYYQLALYKLGWTFYKRERYEEALDRFMALLDYKASKGYDFAQSRDKEEQKRVDDAFRVISLSFSNLGGANSVVDYFDRKGKREYEDRVYGNLAEFYFEKQRYSDAVAAYAAFITPNPFHKVSPQFQMRVIEIHLVGGFSKLVIEAKKQFIEKYGLKAAYWRHFEPGSRPEVLAWLKTNLNDMAGHYHALYQGSKEMQEKRINFIQAAHWYREFLASFPTDHDAPSVNYVLADLYLEMGFLDRAALEYEKTAYEYPRHEKSSQAGYAAIYAWRQNLAGVGADAKAEAMKKVVSSSIKFASTYPEHEKAAIVLGAAADDLYNVKEYQQAATVARRLIDGFPGAGSELLRGAWLVAGHASYELAHYAEAETAYEKLLELMSPGDQSRTARIENLAASIYKQGEQANAQGDHRAAAAHFLRVGRLAPTAKIRANAEYDAAAALILVKDWKTAAVVLAGFRGLFPGHALQPEVTLKIAYVYREDGQFSLAAAEYERMERDSKDDEVRREALLTAAELHEKAGNQARMLVVYRRYQYSFPHPVEPNLETRDKIAEIFKKKNNQDGYLAELGQIVALEAAAAGERTPRTRALASKAALVLADHSFNQFAEVKLIEPVEANLRKKKELMKIATRQFSTLLDYEAGDVTAAATFYLAEMYADFSKDLKESERPAGLSALEREEYDLAIEEQAYPFEEKAIATHKSNLELISRGVYGEWIERSLRKLAIFVPARYDKPEEASPVITSLDRYVFAIEHPEPSAPKTPRWSAAQTGDAKRTVKETAKAETHFESGLSGSRK
jgi:TolA-binding protein